MLQRIYASGPKVRPDMYLLNTAVLTIPTYPHAETMVERYLAAVLGFAASMPMLSVSLKRRQRRLALIPLVLTLELLHLFKATNLVLVRMPLAMARKLVLKVSMEPVPHGVLAIIPQRMAQLATMATSVTPARPATAAVARAEQIHARRLP